MITEVLSNDGKYFRFECECGNNHAKRGFDPINEPDGEVVDFDHEDGWSGMVRCLDCGAEELVAGNLQKGK